jgi:polyhydroxybutyrate depolymerase
VKRVAAVAIAASLLAACSSSHSSVVSPPGHDTVPVTTTTASATSTGCAAHHAVAPGISEHTLRSGGVTRHYLVDVPSNYDGSTPFAIVFGLHALTVDYHFVPSMTGFELGARDHFIGVSPSGLVTRGTPYWDAAPTSQNYDVTFLAALLNSLETTFCVDTTKVFSTGMSNGAQMSSLLACRLSDRITAIAPVSGEEYLAPCTGRPVPIMAFHGSADPILPYRGGGLNATRIADLYRYDGHLPSGLPAPLGIDASMRLWAVRNGCRPAPRIERIAPHVVRRTWQGCRAATVLYVIEGGGHSWPGKPMPAFEQEFGRGTTEIDATKLMFTFFFGPT